MNDHPIVPPMYANAPAAEDKVATFVRESKETDLLAALIKTLADNGKLTTAQISANMQPEEGKK